MTPNKKLEQETELLGWRREDIAEWIGTDVKTLGEWLHGESPNPHYREELCKLFGKDAEELGLTKDENGASYAGNTIPISQRTPPHLLVHTISGLQGKKRRQLRVGWLFMSITVCIIVLLFAVGISGLIIPKTQAKLAVGTLLYFYHTPNTGSIYPTYVNSIAWSPDSQYIASATGDQAVHVLEPAAQEEVFVYHGHHRWVNTIVWFPDGKRIASASADHTVQVWDATTGTNVSTFTSSSSVWTVAVSSDGNLIAFAGKDGIVQVWQVSPQVHIYTYIGQAHAGGIWGLAFSPDGKRIASGDSSGVIQVWDASSGGHVLTYSGHTKQIYDLKWSPNGQYIASASMDGTVQVWNASNGSTVYIHSFPSTPMEAVSWSPDGTRIAWGSANGTVQVWDAFDGGHLFVYRHHSGAVYTVAWSPDGSRIASGDESGSVQVWQAQ
jgi:WD40 repeat protein